MGMENDMSRVFVIGGEWQGCYRQLWQPEKGHQVELFEKNEKLGKKLYITGKGRCNLTNACDRDTFFEHIVSNPKFLYGAFHQFNNYDTMDFEEIGLPLKIERGIGYFLNRINHPM